MSYYLLTNKRLFINLFIYRSVFHFPIDRQISAFGRLECPPVNFNTYYYKFKYVTQTVFPGNTFLKLYSDLSSSAIFRNLPDFFFLSI